MRQIVKPVLSAVSLTICFFLLQGCSCGFFYKCEDIPVTIPHEVTGNWQCIRLMRFSGLDSNTVNDAWFLNLKSNGTYTNTIGSQVTAEGLYYTYTINNTLKLHKEHDTFDYLITLLQNDTMKLQEDVIDGSYFLYIKQP